MLSNINIILKDNISNNIVGNDKNNSNKSLIVNKKRNNEYIKKPLFPYRYYLCTIFIRNIDITKNSLFFTKKFLVVYNFISQLFDISSYLILQKEFEIMKNTILVEEYRKILENRQKINVNDIYFNVKMKECLDNKKFSILGNINYKKK